MFAYRLFWLVAQDEAPKVNPLALMRADHIMISTADYRATLDWYNSSILALRCQREWDVAGHPDVEVGYIAANGFMIEVVGTPQPFQSEKSFPLMCLPLCLTEAMCIWPSSSADVDAVAAALNLSVAV